jgi:hypothetical protein
MPNPANDRITLTNPNGKATQAMIYDMVGNLVLKTATVEAINIASLNTGSYILVAQDAAGVELGALALCEAVNSPFQLRLGAVPN